MPTTITPSNSVSKPIKQLMDALSNSAAARTFLGAANPAAALARIYLHELPKPAATRDDYSSAEWAALHPHILLTPPDGQQWYELIAAGTGAHYSCSFRAQMEFTRIVVPGSKTEGDICLEFIETVGGIIDELAGVRYEPTGFAFTRITIDQPVWRADPQDRIELGDLQALTVFIAAEESQ